MKKIIFSLLSVIAILSSFAIPTLANDAKPVSVTLNGNIVDCEKYGSPATIIDSRTLVPLRAIFEALGASVDWNDATQTVTSEKDGTKISLTINSNVMTVNGEAKESPLVLNNSGNSLTLTAKEKLDIKIA